MTFNKVQFSAAKKKKKSEGLGTNLKPSSQETHAGGLSNSARLSPKKTGKDWGCGAV